MFYYAGKTVILKFSDYQPKKTSGIIKNYIQLLFRPNLTLASMILLFDL